MIRPTKIGATSLQMRSIRRIVALVCDLKGATRGHCITHTDEHNGAMGAEETDLQNQA